MQLSNRTKSKLKIIFEKDKKTKHGTTYIERFNELRTSIENYSEI
jgi:hypothetical protein